ncbi:inorganic diphosphatase [Candidatus Clostridium radicumherbarum]|uniref:inorganic diphosphatase n=1 Tax=Candidatus Clostridium radicumherbarum TaxID=3381662 RepID=A0ABW8TWS3_9CLOT
MDNYLGKKVNVIIDRTLGSNHPEHGFIYPINYGYIPNTVSGDGEEVDAYVIGEFEPLVTFEGYVIAIIHRFNDNEDKLVVCKEKNNYTVEQIKSLTEFQERFFKSEIITLDNNVSRYDACIELDFTQEKDEVLHMLRNKKTMCLATSAYNRVTARSMSCIVINEKIYFQTDKTFLKYNQIMNNPYVALCVDNIQIEGLANIKGHPYSDRNKYFIEKFKREHNGSFLNYSHMENEIVVEVKPSLITLWKYKDGKPFRDFLDFINGKASREYYNNSK